MDSKRNQCEESKTKVMLKSLAAEFGTIQSDQLRSSVVWPACCIQRVYCTETRCYGDKEGDLMVAHTERRELVQQLIPEVCHVLSVQLKRHWDIKVFYLKDRRKTTPGLFQKCPPNPSFSLLISVTWLMVSDAALRSSSTRIQSLQLLIGLL